MHGCGRQGKGRDAICIEKALDFFGDRSLPAAGEGTKSTRESSGKKGRGTPIGDETEKHLEDRKGRKRGASECTERARKQKRRRHEERQENGTISP